MLKGAPEVQKLCADFGIPSMDHVAIDTWPSKHAVPLLKAMLPGCHGQSLQLIVPRRFDFQRYNIGISFCIGGPLWPRCDLPAC